MIDTPEVTMFNPVRQHIHLVDQLLSRVPTDTRNMEERRLYQTRLGDFFTKSALVAYSEEDFTKLCNDAQNNNNNNDSMLFLAVEKALGKIQLEKFPQNQRDAVTSALSKLKGKSTITLEEIFREFNLNYGTSPFVIFEGLLVEAMPSEMKNALAAISF